MMAPSTSRRPSTAWGGAKPGRTMLDPTASDSGPRRKDTLRPNRRSVAMQAKSRGSSSIWPGRLRSSIACAWRPRMSE
jgi:hypothetical protein